MRYSVYKNSISATICSAFGACLMISGVAAAVYAIPYGEIELLPAGIVIIAIGFGLQKLAGHISENKRFSAIMKQLRESKLDRQIQESVPFAISVYNQMPDNQMRRAISLLNPQAGEVIQRYPVGQSIEL